MKLSLPWKRARRDEPMSEAPAALPPLSGHRVLQLRTAEHMWGECEIREEDPPIEVLEDVCYVPDRPGGNWGVFDRNDEPVPASLDFMGLANHPMRPRPVNPTPHAGVTETLPDGDYLYGGFVHGHFGHFIVDTMPRLWPLTQGLRPGQKILFHGGGDPSVWWGIPWMVEILSGLGLRQEDLLHVREPVRIKRLELPHRSLQGQAFGHPAFQRMTQKIGSAILDGVAPPQGGRPVYLSKTRLTVGVRRVVNELQLERHLAVRGVEIVFPETLSFKEQLVLFASGRTITGTTNSGLHASVFTAPVRVRAVNPSELINSNFFIIDALNGNDAAYYYPEGARTVSNNQNGFMVEEAFVDPIAIGRELLHLL